MLHRGRYTQKYFLRDGRIFEKNPHTVGGVWACNREVCRLCLISVSLALHQALLTWLDLQSGFGASEAHTCIFSLESSLMSEVAKWSGKRMKMSSTCHAAFFSHPILQGRYEFLRPKVTSLARRIPSADEGMLAFLKCLLQVRPHI